MPKKRRFSGRSDFPAAAIDGGEIGALDGVGTAGGEIHAIDKDGSGIGCEDSENHVDGSGLAGAVGSQQADDLVRFT